MSFPENLGIFVDDFGLPAIITPVGGGSPIFLKGIFNRIGSIYNKGAESHEIEFVVITSEIFGVKQRSEMEIDTVKYIITTILPIEDGNFTKLLLEEKP